MHMCIWGHWVNTGVLWNSVYISKSTLSGRLTDSAYHRLFKNKFKNKDVLSTTDFCIYDFDKKKYRYILFYRPHDIILRYSSG